MRDAEFRRRAHAFISSLYGSKDCTPGGERHALIDAGPADPDACPPDQHVLAIVPWWCTVCGDGAKMDMKTHLCAKCGSKLTAREVF